MQYTRYSVDPTPTMLMIGDRNEFIWFAENCGRKNVVVDSRTREPVGTGRIVSVTPGGPAWGDSATFSVTVDVMIG